MRPNIRIFCQNIRTLCIVLLFCNYSVVSAIVLLFSNCSVNSIMFCLARILYIVLLLHNILQYCRIICQTILRETLYNSHLLKLSTSTTHLYSILSKQENFRQHLTCLSQARLPSCQMAAILHNNCFIHNVMYPTIVMQNSITIAEYRIFWHCRTIENCT